MNNIRKFLLASTFLTLSNSNSLSSMKNDYKQLNESSPLINGSSSSSSSSSSAPSSASYSVPTELIPKLKFCWERISKKLNFYNYKFQDLQELQATLLYFKSIWNEIEELDLCDCNIHDLPDFLTPEKFPNLRIINLSVNPLNKGVLEKISKFRFLRRLGLGSCNIKEFPKEFSQLKITYLDLTHNPLSSKALIQITQMESLEYICLFQCGIKDNFPKKCNLPNLKGLNLYFNNLTPEEQERIRKLFSPKKIQFLE